MGTMKKILSILLCAALVFSCVAIYADEQNTASDVVESSFNPGDALEAISLLSDLGVFDSAKYANYDSTLEITRGEFAAMALEVLGLCDDAEAGEFVQIYTDVDENVANARSITFATQLGLFRGVSDTEFAPDESVSINQAIKVAVCMLGYGEIAEYEGGFPAGYLKYANRLKLTDNVNLDSSVATTRGNVIILMYNTIQAEYLDYSGVNKDGNIYTKSADRTLLYRYHNILKSEGIVTSNEEASIIGDPEEDGIIVVAGERMTTSSPKIHGTIGKNVEYYYRESKGDKELVTLREVRNKVASIKASAGYTFSFAQGSYTVQTESAKNDQVFNLGKSYDVIYNGTYITGNEKGVDFEKLLSPASGTITLIDNNQDNIYEVVIVEEATIVIFNNYDSYAKKIYDLKDRKYDVIIPANADVKVTDTLGNEVELSKVSKESVLMIYTSAYSNKYEIVVCDATASGTVSTIDSEGTIDLGSTTLELATNTRCDGGTITPGERYTFYLDKYGDIVYCDCSTSEKYAYILTLPEYEPSNVNPVQRVKVMTSRGITIMYFANKVTLKDIDGENTYTVDVIAEKLKEKIGAIYSDGSNVNSRILVRYRENSDGEITSVSLPYALKTDPWSISGGVEVADKVLKNYDFFKVDYLLSDAPATVRFNTNNMSMAMWVALEKGCPVYVVPTFDMSTYEDSQYGASDASSFIAGQYTTLSAFTGANDQYELYSTDSEVRLINQVVNTKSGGAFTNIANDVQVNIVITSISDVVDKNGNIKKKITGYQKGVLISLTASNDDVVKISSIKNTTLVDGNGLISPTFDATKKKELVRGDIIRVSTDINGEISTIALVYDSQNEVLGYANTGYTIPYDTARTTCGEVIDLFMGYARLNVYSDSVTAKRKETYMLSSAQRILIYDKETNTCELGTADDISIGDKIVVNQGGATLRELVVYKEGGNN